MPRKNQERASWLDKVKPENSALLVIDMSRDFIEPAEGSWGPGRRDFPEGQLLVGRLAPLIEHCREIGLPVIYLNHVHQPGARDKGTLAERFPAIAEGKVLQRGTRGVEIVDQLAPKPGDLVIDKIRQSGFPYTSLDPALRELGVRNVIIAGVSVGGCVESTARDAVSRDFHVIMLSDGTAGAGLPDLGWGEVDSQTLSRVFLTNFCYHFGQVISVGDLITAIAPKKETYAS